MKTIEKKDEVYSAVERILDNYLEMNNHRKTPERYAILRAVYDMEGHFTIDELGNKREWVIMGIHFVRWWRKVGRKFCFVCPQYRQCRCIAGSRSKRV